MEGFLPILFSRSAAIDSMRYPTSKVGAIGETGCHLAVDHDNVDNALLNEVHLIADGALLDDDIPWLVNLVLQLCHDGVHKVRVGVGEEGHRGDQRPTVVVDDVLTEALRELVQNHLLIEELALVAVLKVVADADAQVSRQLSVAHVLLHLFELLAVLPTTAVQRLYQIGGVAEEEGVAGGAGDHAQQCQPHVRQRLRGKAAVADAQHVRHGLEQRPGVLVEPLIDGHPGVGREALQHGDQKLKTAAPVTDEQHHADEVEDFHKEAGHVQELSYK
ncbi:hypothetical protein TYRP_002160 [Tyrophagus putrescentiae]|nr:hypothetical protein TYRP_002160 [Tyrophagus putrescentiae]